jgi:hypothetical protein
MAISKPDKKFSLDDFASDEGNSVPNVGTLHMGLPILRLSEAKDFVKLHPWCAPRLTGQVAGCAKH